MCPHLGTGDSNCNPFMCPEQEQTVMFGGLWEAGSGGKSGDKGSSLLPCSLAKYTVGRPLNVSRITLNRLAEGRKVWRKDHSFGFVAVPRKKSRGMTNLMMWEASFRERIESGRKETCLNYGCSSKTTIHHPHLEVQLGTTVISPECVPFGPCAPVHPQGSWGLEADLIGIQEHLNELNIQDVAQAEAYTVYLQNRVEY